MVLLERREHLEDRHGLRTQTTYYRDRPATAPQLKRAPGGAWVFGRFDVWVFGRLGVCAFGLCGCHWSDLGAFLGTALALSGALLSILGSDGCGV